jgi:hypothetical protein
VISLIVSITTRGTRMTHATTTFCFVAPAPVSALAFALSAEPDEAIYEAAHAVESPEDLVRQLRD